MNSDKKKLARERKRKSRMFLKELKSDMQDIFNEVYTQEKIPLVVSSKLFTNFY